MKTTINSLTDLMTALRITKNGKRIIRVEKAGDFGSFVSFACRKGSIFKAAGY